MNIELYNSADAAGADWDAVAQHAGVFLSRAYLRTMAEGADECAVVVREGGRPVAVARCRRDVFIGRPIGHLLDDAVPGVAFVARRLRLMQRAVRIPLVLCGDPYAAGEHGFAIAADVDRLRALEALREGVERAADRLAERGEVQAVLIKEFCDDCDAGLRRFEAAGYSRFDAGPGMRLRLDPRWQSFDDYLASLTSKFRVKARRAYSKSAALVRRRLTTREARAHLPRLQALYDGVVARGDYRLGHADLGQVIELAESLGDGFALHGYLLDDTLVGFTTALVGADTVDAHLVGFDDRFNREHGIYPRMLYDYLQLGLAQGVARVDYGRTATEIKSTLGAEPVPTLCCIRHRRPILNRLLPAVTRAVQVPDEPQRAPFKKAWYETRMHPA